MVLRTGKWRKALAHYLVEHDLPHAGSLAAEKGWVTNTNKPFLKPGRHVIQRVGNHLEARDLLSAKHNDGTLNSYMQKLLIPPPPKKTRGDLAVEFAMKEVGTHESPWGSNSGTRVRFYETSTGAYAQPWCASFFWKMHQLAGYKGATSAGAWNSTDRLGAKVADVHHALPGDGVSFNTGNGHIGMFVALIGKNVRTIDGNTSDQVAVRDRPVSMIHSICRPS